MNSLLNLFTLILTGDFRAPIFGLMEDAQILQPIYSLHQLPAFDIVCLAALILVLAIMLPAIKSAFDR